MLKARRRAVPAEGCALRGTQKARWGWQAGLRGAAPVLRGLIVDDWRRW